MKHRICVQSIFFGWRLFENFEFYSFLNELLSIYPLPFEFVLFSRVNLNWLTMTSLTFPIPQIFLRQIFTFSEVWNRSCAGRCSEKEFVAFKKQTFSEKGIFSLTKSVGDANGAYFDRSRRRLSKINKHFIQESDNFMWHGGMFLKTNNSTTNTSINVHLKIITWPSHEVSWLLHMVKHIHHYYICSSVFYNFRTLFFVFFFHTFRQNKLNRVVKILLESYNAKIIKSYQS